METFIVRFYRRALKSMQELAGTVERVGSGERAGFASQEQLLDQLLKVEKGSRDQSSAGSATGVRQDEDPK